MERFNYFRLDAVNAKPRGSRNHVIILVLAKDGRYSHFSPDLKKLLEGVAAEKVATEGRLDELIIVAEEEFFKRALLLETVHSYQRGGAQSYDPEGRAPYYNAYHYHIFAIVIPEHVEVVPHRIMSAEEEAAFFRRERLVPSDLEPIYEADPPAIWAGARLGQLIEVTRLSEVTGRAIAVRRVTRTPAA